MCTARLRCDDAQWVITMAEGSVAPPLDLAKALTLAGGDKTLLIELTELFLEELPGRLDALQAAIREGDAKHTRHEAHSLKGALANLGATAACDLAYELEGLGRAASLETAPAALRRLEQELERITGFLAVPGWCDRA